VFAMDYVMSATNKSWAKLSYLSYALRNSRAPPAASMVASCNTTSSCHELHTPCARTPPLTTLSSRLRAATKASSARLEPT
jgi:hypothetical protein